MLALMGTSAAEQAVLRAVLHTGMAVREAQRFLHLLGGITIHIKNVIARGIATQVSEMNSGIKKRIGVPCGN